MSLVIQRDPAVGGLDFNEAMTKLRSASFSLAR